MIEKVVLHNQMTVTVKQRNIITIFVNCITIDFISTVILARFLHGSEENVVIINLRAQVFIPFLDKKDTCLCSCMWLEHIAMQAYHSQNAATVSNIFTQ